MVGDVCVQLNSGHVWFESRYSHWLLCSFLFSLGFLQVNFSVLLQTTAFPAKSLPIHHSLILKILIYWCVSDISSRIVWYYIGHHFIWQLEPVTSHRLCFTYKTQQNFDVQWTPCLLEASRRKAFRAPSLNMVRYNLLLTAVRWADRHGSRLTAWWHSGGRCASCYHVRWPEWRSDVSCRIK